MKLLFVHGTKIKEDTNKNYYTGGSYSKEIWNRYLAICTELTIIARKESTIYDVEVAKKKFNYFDKEKIDFIEVANLNFSVKAFLSPKKRKEKEMIIKNAVFENDFIIARLPSNEGNIAIKYAKEYDKPYLVEVVGCSWDALWNYNFKGKLLAPIRFIKQKQVVRNSPYTVYVTKEFLQKRYPTTGEKVNCSNVALTNLDQNILDKRIEKIKHKNSKIVIGTTAAVDVKYKGQQSVIKALGKLKKRGIINFEYQLVGGGDQTYLSSVAKDYNVSEHVIFLGTMPHQEVFSWLDTIDVYIQPSKTEGLPRALIEAMSRGVLSIGTNAGGIPELLEEKYIVDKTKNTARHLLDILKVLDKEALLRQAQRNFIVSKEYEGKVIESRRNEFFNKFIDNQIKH